MSFGPGSAFSFAAPTRPPRRVGSGGSFGGVASPAATSPVLAGPTPVDPPTAPSLGSFTNGEVTNGHSPANGAFSNGSHPAAAPSLEHSSRSFSSILSPSLAATVNGGGQLGENGVDAAGKPFLYSREFLLSLYDDEKAKKRPIELASHDVATRDLSGENGGTHKPWSLQGYREGEKELFATSIHPANARPSRLNRTESTISQNGASATLDLGSLGTLPRDRDRGLGSPSMRSPSVEKEAFLGSAGRRTRERSAGAPMGILGGVLGGIAAGTPTRKREESTGPGGKEVWQGGKWRRAAQAEAEEAEKTQLQRTTSAFGSRRFPLPEDGGSRPASPGGDVPESWDDGEDKAATGSSALNGHRDPLANETDLTASVLGSLALDSDLAADPLLSRSKPATGSQTPSRGGPPPGLVPTINPADVEWQYRDPAGQLQGPFAATMMQDWFKQQFFTPDLRVKRTTDLEFESLETLMRKTGDAEKPFLAPKPSAPSSNFSTAPGTPQNAAWGAAPRAQTPLEQLTAAVAQGRFGAGGAANSSFYEAFGSAAASPAAQAQTLPQSFGASSAIGRSPSVQGAVDPWGAPIAAQAASPAWQHAQQPQQQLFQQGHQQNVQSPADLLIRQLAQQQQAQHQQQGQQPGQFGQHGGVDVFGRPSPLPQSPFFDPNQLPAQSPTAWIGQQLPQQHQQQFQGQHQQFQQQQQQQPWNALGGVQSPAAQFQQQPQHLAPAVPTPIGPPAAQQQQQQQQQAPAPVPAQSPWETLKPVEQPAPTPVEAKQPVKVETSTAAPVKVEEKAKEVKVEPTVAPAAKEKASKKTKAAATPAVAEAVPAATVVEKEKKVDSTPSSAVESRSASPASATKPATAPWAKDETSRPTTATTPAAPSPSLREIQEAEALEASKRKQAARIVAAQANIQAAQRAAALEAQQAAESLPSSASWAAGPAQVPPVKAAPAPWIKPAASASPAAKASGKTLKEIQEEEERRKKAQVAAAQAAGVASSVGKGYAGSIGQAAPATGAGWSTIAVKPAVARAAAPAAKGVIPGLPSAPGARAATPVAAKLPPAVPVVRTSVPVASTPAPAPSKVTIVPRSVQVSSSSYDMENPPPPSTEFMAWTKQALKGLQVPLDEFVQMLLSFPLDASADVLEIISDSVYANSSTLDGRRFANDFTARRKNDVAVRYPKIFASKSGVKTSMASILSASAQPKVSEWSVPIKKKKGGK